MDTTNINYYKYIIMKFNVIHLGVVLILSEPHQSRQIKKK